MVTIHSPPKDSYLSTSPLNLAHITKYNVANEQVAESGVDDISFIDEEDNQNLDSTRR